MINSQLATRNSQLATRNSQLATLKLLKILSKYSVLFLLLFFSCSEEKEFIKNDSTNKYTIKEYNWKEANKILKFKEAQSKVMKSIKTNSNKLIVENFLVLKLMKVLLKKFQTETILLTIC